MYKRLSRLFGYIQHEFQWWHYHQYRHLLSEVILYMPLFNRFSFYGKHIHEIIAIVEASGVEHRYAEQYYEYLKNLEKIKEAR